MNYSESLAYLDSLNKFGIRLGMERIECLLKMMGNPEKKFKSVHVAGTNGKGSVVSMISNILLSANLHVGKFTSPHLVKYNERIEIDGHDVDDETFAKIISNTKQVADDIVCKGICEQPTQFEILTAAAFLLFAEKNVDYAIIEVGLGGLWDSTNVINPVVSVITNITLEHTDRLGKTLPRIAMQKAGIIKENVPVVTACEGEETLGPIVTMAMFKKAPVYLYGKAFYGKELVSSMSGQTFTLYAGDTYKSNYDILLPGIHQIKNAAVAIVAAKLISKQDDRISEVALHNGVANTKWPGRLERISVNPDIILDGAHNPDGAKILRMALDKYYPGQKRTFVFGMMSDKEIDKVIEVLIRDEDRVYTVRADDGPRSAEARDLAKKVGINAIAMNTIPMAYEEALKHNDGVVIVCGSLYLVGSFKSIFQR